MIAIKNKNLTFRMDHISHLTRMKAFGLATCLLLFGFGGRIKAQSCSTPSAGGAVSSSGATQIYVDGSAGSDVSGCGPSTSPCKTIQYAVNEAASYTVADVVVNPGTYREAITLPNTYNENGSQTLIIEAATPGTVYISGADNWSANFTANGDGSYSASWPYTWGYAPQPFESTGGPALSCLSLRREMVFVNGTPLTQVLQGPLATPSTFFVVDGQSDSNSGDSCPALTGSSNVITIYPPDGTNMSTADVEVATRDELFNTPNGMQNLELKGLTFEYANPAANNNGTAQIHITGNDLNNEGANIVLDDITSQYSNWTGLYLGANEDTTVEDSTFTNNGENGVSVYRPLNFLFNSDTFTYNNWRGDESYGTVPGFTGWDADGMKIVRGHGVEVDNSTFNNNLTGGLWFDTDSENVCVQYTQLEHNLTNGISWEANQGPMLAYQDQVCSNQGQGFQTANTEYGTIRQCSIYDNGNNSYFIGGSSSTRSVTNWQTGAGYQLLTEDWVWDGDDFATGPDTDTNAYLLGTSLGTIQPFWSTILSNYNDFYAPNNSNPFDVPDSGGGLTFSQWQSLTSQDASSNENSITSCALPPAPTCIGSDCPGSPITLTIANTGADEKYKILSPNEAAQSWIAPANAVDMTDLKVALALGSGSNYAITVHLRTSLTGADIWSSTFTPSVSSTNYKSPDWVDVPGIPTGGIAITSGNTYYVVMDTASTTSYYYWAVSSTQSYTNGYFFYNGTQKDYSSYTQLTFSQTSGGGGGGGGSNTTTLVLANSGADENYAKIVQSNETAQSFVATAGSITGIQISLAKENSSTSDYPITVSLENTLDGTVIWSTSFTPSVSSTDYKNPSAITVPVSQAISVTSGATYYLVIDTSNTSSKYYYMWAVNGSQPYTSGYFYNGGSQKNATAYVTLTEQ